MSERLVPGTTKLKVRDHDRNEYGMVGTLQKVERGCCLLLFKNGTERWISRDSLEEQRGVTR